MAVAENAVATSTPEGAKYEFNLGLAGLVGGCVLLAGLGLIFGALPVFWSELFPPAKPNEPAKVNEFLSGALLLIAGLAAILAVGFVWLKLDKAFSMPGLRAGSVVGAVLLFIAAWITFGVGEAMGEQQNALLLLGIIGLTLLVGVIWLATRAAYGRMLHTLEDQGWFTSASFKGSQGVRVRRAAVFGILIIGLSGIITLAAHGSLGSTRAAGNEWYWNIVGTGAPSLYVPLLSRVNVLGPLLMAVGVFWFAWRVVNWPTFADFLIATEAEMNKVSWTTRRRLYQDTIVVLATVFLMTAFLFALDLLWFQVLNHPWVHVLQVNLKAEQAKQQEKTQW